MNPQWIIDNFGDVLRVLTSAVVASTLAGCSLTGGDVGPSATVSTADLCDLLTGEALPAGREAGTPERARAQIAAAIADFYDEREAVLDPRALDEQTLADCPEIRARVLKLAGATSFTDFPGWPVPARPAWSARPPRS